ncbi:unnamed protein product [Durusdinium trenchii]|uniref:Uncharacterized protein n=1 Tax=Durusdinium trenchii TaxID=1381693 RepID=A0ABP0KHV2_9DINO
MNDEPFHGFSPAFWLWQRLVVWEPADWRPLTLEVDKRLPTSEEDWDRDHFQGTPSTSMVHSGEQSLPQAQVLYFDLGMLGQRVDCSGSDMSFTTAPICASLRLRSSDTIRCMYCTIVHLKNPEDPDISPQKLVLGDGCH